MIIDIRQRLVDLGLVVVSHREPLNNFYYLPGLYQNVVWLKKNYIAVTKDLYIFNYGRSNTILSSVDPEIYYDFFEAEKQIKKIIERYKELLLELKIEKIREKLKDLEKDFEDDR